MTKGPVTKLDNVEIRRPFLERSIRVAEDVKHRRSSNHRMVRGSKNLVALGIDFHEFRRY